MKRILLEFLRDILAAIAEVESFVEDVDSEHSLRAIKNVEEGRNLITVQLEDLQLTE